MNERWVCKRCFADNNDADASCQRCGLARGAALTQADQPEWTAQGGQSSRDQRPAWRGLLRFWWIPALVVVLAVGYFANGRRGDDGSLTSAGIVSVDALREGDCFNGGEEDEISDVDGVPCTESHAYEVFATTTYDGDGSFPTGSAFEAIFFEVCEPEFEPYVGLAWEESRIEGSMISPSEESWGSGDRSFICILYDSENEALTESLAGAAR